VLASGAGGLAFAAGLQRAAPHEDVVVLCDHAYAPYGRRPGRVVRDRVLRLADELLEQSPKVLVLASAQATLDVLDELRRRMPVPVVGLDRLLPHAVTATNWQPLAVVTGQGCVRGVQQARWLRGQRDGVLAMPVQWAGLAELVESGAASSPQAAALVAQRMAELPEDRAGVLLACPHAAAVRPLVESNADGMAVTDVVDITTQRVLQVLRRGNALAHRHRAGRRIVISSHPGRAQRGVAALMRPAPAPRVRR